MAGFQNKEKVKARVRRIPAAVRKEIKPEMERQTTGLVQAMRARIPVERPPGAHAKPHSGLPRPAGTLKKSTRWAWRKRKSFTIIVFSKPLPMPNLGRWVEKGTRPGVRGQSYRWTGYRKQRRRLTAMSWDEDSGQWVKTANKRYLTSMSRKIYRTHPGTKARPYFFPVWNLYVPRIKSGMAVAWRRGLHQS